MPDMDGEGLLRAMRALPGLGEVPFVAVSAVRSEARIRSVLAAGADAFLLKPFPLRDLIEKVRSLLDRPRTKREESGGMSDYTSPTRPVVAMSHTTSTTVPSDARAPSLRAARGRALARGTPSRPRRRLSPPRRCGSRPCESCCPGRRPRPRRPTRRARASPGDRRVELGPPVPGLGFGRFTRVEARGRSFVVFTEAVRQPRFTVTTVVTEKERAAAEDRVGAASPAGPRRGRRPRACPARPAARRHPAQARAARPRPRVAARGVVRREPQRRGEPPRVGHVGGRAGRGNGGRDGRDRPPALPDPREGAGRGGRAARLRGDALRPGGGGHRPRRAARPGGRCGRSPCGAAPSRPRRCRPTGTGSSSRSGRPRGGAPSSSSGSASTSGCGARPGREPQAEGPPAGRDRGRRQAGAGATSGGGGGPADPDLRAAPRVRGGAPRPARPGPGRPRHPGRGFGAPGSSCASSPRE